MTVPAELGLPFHAEGLKLLLGATDLALPQWMTVEVVLISTLGTRVAEAKVVAGGGTIETPGLLAASGVAGIKVLPVLGFGGETGCKSRIAGTVHKIN